MRLFKTLSLLLLSNLPNITNAASLQDIIDQVFVMDCTGSMGSYIETAKTKILELATKVSTKYPKKDLRLGFIGYRDITDWSDSEKQFIEIPFSVDYNKFKQTLENSVSAIGGGDLPEDVFTGLNAASNLKWEGGVRMLTLLSDAPHNEKSGRKSYADFKPVLKKFSDDTKNSDAVFTFSFFKIGESTGNLGEKLKVMMPEGINFVEHKLEVATKEVEHKLEVATSSSYSLRPVAKEVGSRPKPFFGGSKPPSYRSSEDRDVFWKSFSPLIGGSSSTASSPSISAFELSSSPSMSEISGSSLLKSLGAPSYRPVARPSEDREPELYRPEPKLYRLYSSMNSEVDKKSSYIDTVFRDIKEAVDRHSKLSSGSETE